MTVTVQPVMVESNDKGVTITWTGADTNVGAPVDLRPYGELTMQAVGDGTTVALTGSNDGGTTYGTIGAGYTATVSGNAITRIVEHPGLVRPTFTGGSATKFIISASKQFY